MAAVSNFDPRQREGEGKEHGERDERRETNTGRKQEGEYSPRRRINAALRLRSDLFQANPPSNIHSLIPFNTEVRERQRARHLGEGEPMTPQRSGLECGPLR